jgi:MFS family permease
VEVSVPVKRDFAILYLAVLASRVGFGVIIIIFPFYIMGASDLEVAVALALYPILEAVSALPIGRLCDTSGRKAIFVLSLGYIAVLMGSIGLTQNLYAISTIHALMGVGAAGVTVSTLTMVTDLTRTETRGKGMGTFDFANVGGYGLGLLLGSSLHSVFSSELNRAFFVSGLVVGVAFLLAYTVLREPAHTRRSTDKSFDPFKALDPHTKSILPIWLGVTVLLGMVFFLPRAFSRVSIGGGQTAGILLLGLIVLGLGAVGFGALSDRIGRGRVLLVGVIGLFGLLVSLQLFIEGGPESLFRSLPILGVFALMTSALVPSILATVGDKAALERRGSAMGLYSVMLSGGTAVGTLIAGVAHLRSGLPGIVGAGIVLFLVACMASLILWLRNRAKETGKRL